MIVEVVAGCVTVCFLATLQFAKWASNREERMGGAPSAAARRKAILEKHRILERDRAEWQAALPDKETAKEMKEDNVPTLEIMKIDRKLLELADEEAEIPDDE